MIEAYILILFVIVTYIVGRAIGYEQAKKIQAPNVSKQKQIN